MSIRNKKLKTLLLKNKGLYVSHYLDLQPNNSPGLGLDL